MKWVINQPSSLFTALELKAPESSNNTIRGWIKSGRISVNGVRAYSGKLQLAIGDEIALQSKTERVGNGVRILYDDAHIIAIYKPSGLLSVSTLYETQDTAHRTLLEHYAPQRIHVVHRIDQETSGVMLFARSEEAYEKLKGIFESHSIEREYWAVLEGELKAESGDWESYLWEDKNYFVWSSQDPNKGRKAVTHYNIVATHNGYSLAKLYLETGRKHQIRVHCAAAGCPVVGDKRYGSKTNPLRRMGLHARSIGFEHPITGKKMFFEVPLPPAFLQCVPYRL
ncbi:MAG: rluA [Chlamydiales bacterium]|jgi:tRNA pseudouridine32 synthase/23S rRNA pseudouridine746 synthase/23S rRNA pseudouridine1911/1915/1917 synthase|nr:rluA [Chlamydiales bacterium]